MEVVAHKPFHHRVMRHIGADLNSVYGYLSMVVLVIVAIVLWVVGFKDVKRIVTVVLFAFVIFLTGFYLTPLPYFVILLFVLVIVIPLILVALKVIPMTPDIIPPILGCIGVIYFISFIAMFAS